MRRDDEEISIKIADDWTFSRKKKSTFREEMIAIRIPTVELDF